MTDITKFMSYERASRKADRKRRKSRVHGLLAQCMWLQEQFEPADVLDSGGATGIDPLTIRI